MPGGVSWNFSLPVSISPSVINVEVVMMMKSNIPSAFGSRRICCGIDRNKRMEISPLGVINNSGIKSVRANAFRYNALTP